MEVLAYFVSSEIFSDLLCLGMRQLYSERIGRRKAAFFEVVMDYLQCSAVAINVKTYKLPF
jgi:hypothetical protein